MSRKTTLFAGAAGLLMAAALPGVSPALADYRDYDDGLGRYRPLPRVFAEGAALDHYAARTQAVHRWRAKVADRYGYEFSCWWTARAKDVKCQRVADDDPSWDTYRRRDAVPDHRRYHYDPVARCTVSAIPSRAWESFSWYTR